MTLFDASGPLGRHTDPQTTVDAGRQAAQPRRIARAWALEILEGYPAGITIDGIVDRMRDEGYAGPESTVEGAVSALIVSRRVKRVAVGTSRHGAPQAIVAIPRDWEAS